MIRVSLFLCLAAAVFGTELRGRRSLEETGGAGAGAEGTYDNAALDNDGGTGDQDHYDETHSGGSNDNGGNDGSNHNEDHHDYGSNHNDGSVSDETPCFHECLNCDMNKAQETCEHFFDAGDAEGGYKCLESLGCKACGDCHNNRESSGGTGAHGSGGTGDQHHYGSNDHGSGGTGAHSSGGTGDQHHYGSNDHGSGGTGAHSGGGTGDQHHYGSNDHDSGGTGDTTSSSMHSSFSSNPSGSYTNGGSGSSYGGGDRPRPRTAAEIIASLRAMLDNLSTDATTVGALHEKLVELEEASAHCSNSGGAVTSSGQMEPLTCSGGGGESEVTFVPFEQAFGAGLAGRIADAKAMGNRVCFCR